MTRSILSLAALAVTAIISCPFVAAQEAQDRPTVGDPVGVRLKGDAYKAYEKLSRNPSADQQSSPDRVYGIPGYLRKQSGKLRIEFSSEVVNASQPRLLTFSRPVELSEIKALDPKGLPKLRYYIEISTLAGASLRSWTLEGEVSSN